MESCRVRRSLGRAKSPGKPHQVPGRKVPKGSTTCTPSSARQLLHKGWLRSPGRAMHGELGAALNAKLRSLAFTLREAGSRWKVSSRGTTRPNQDHRKTDWRW